MTTERKTLLINRKFQLTFLGYMLIMAAVTIAIIYASNTYFFWMFVELGQSMNLPADHAFFQFLTEQRNSMNWVFLVTALIVMGAMIVGGLILSHRVAGPLHRLDRHMKKVARGSETHEVRFRKGDFFQELARSYNEQLRVLIGRK